MAGELISDNAYDAALDYIDTNAETVYICSQAPTTYTEASSTYKLGTKTSAAVGTPTAGDTDGRKVVITAITDGTVDSSGTATHWALCKDSATAELLAAGPLASSQVVTSGNTFTLPATDVTLRDATQT